MEEDIIEVAKDEDWRVKLLLNGLGNEWSECEKKCDCISNSFFFLLCFAVRSLFFHFLG